MIRPPQISTAEPDVYAEVSETKNADADVGAEVKFLTIADAEAEADVRFLRRIRGCGGGGGYPTHH